MTRIGRRKAVFYGLLLFAAVVGVIIDRTRFSPVPARGDRIVPAGPQTPSAAGVEADTSTIGPSIAPVFDRPSGSPEEEVPAGPPAVAAVRDAFTASPAIQQYYRHRRPDGTGAGKAEDDPETQAVQMFSQTHQLQATCVQGKRSWALVDNKVLRVGDNLDGFGLRQIDHYRVVFSRGGNNVDLRLAAPFAAKVPATEPR
jgi:hypothetical protein